MDILKYFGFVVGSQNQIINLNGFIIAAQASNNELNSSATLQQTQHTHVSPQPMAVSINNHQISNNIGDNMNGDSGSRELNQFTGSNESQTNVNGSEILAIFPDENNSSCSSNGNRSNSCNNLNLCSCCRISNNSQISNINYLLHTTTNNPTNSNCVGNIRSEDCSVSTANVKRENQIVLSKPYSDLDNTEHSNCSINKRVSDV